MISSEDIAYIAGLFDGEGSIHFKRGTEKKKKHKGKGYRTSNSLRLSMEITMTDESVLRWVLEVLVNMSTAFRPRDFEASIKIYCKEKIMEGNVVSLDQYKQIMSLE